MNAPGKDFSGRREQNRRIVILLILFFFWVISLFVGVMLYPVFVTGSTFASSMICVSVLLPVLYVRRILENRLGPWISRLLALLTFLVGMLGSVTTVVIFCHLRAELTRPSANRIVAALEAFHEEHEEYPRELEALRPDYLEAMPGKSLLRVQVPITYEKTESGYRLWCHAIDGAGWLYSPDLPEGSWETVDER